MLRIILTLSLLILVTCFIGCSSDEKTPVNPGGATTATVSADPEIVYGAGFSDLEKGADTSWRWMGNDGVITLKNAKKEMRLRLMGSVPMNRIPKSTITVILNGEQLGQIPGAQSVDKEFSIPAAQQGSGATSELRLKMDKVFVPKEVDKNSTDDRKLGFSVTKIVWEPKQ